jgi:hypothetical protein
MRVKCMLAFIVVFALLACKTPDALFRAQFWAEDGSIFFQQQFGHSTPLLFTSYAGYLHVIPRLIAWVATAFPYRYAPLIYNFSAIALGAGSIFYFAKKSTFLSPFWITVAIFLLAPTNGEEFGDIANLQWLLQFSVFAVALYPGDGNASANTEGPGRRIARYTAIACLALTGPFSIFCALIGLALCVANVMNTRFGFRFSPFKQASDWWSQLDKAQFSIVALGGGVQALTLVFFGYRPNGSFSAPVAKHLLISGSQTHLLSTHMLPPSVFALIMLTIGVAVYVRERRQFAIKHLVIVGLAAFAAAQVLGVSTPNFVLAADTFFGDRYYFFAKVAFWMSAAALLQGNTDAARITWRNLLVPLALLVIQISHPGMLQRRPLPDLHWKEASRQLDVHGEPVTIPINPTPWDITVNRP